MMSTPGSMVWFYLSTSILPCIHCGHVSVCFTSLLSCIQSLSPTALTPPVPGAEWWWWPIPAGTWCPLPVPIVVGHLTKSLAIQTLSWLSWRFPLVFWILLQVASQVVITLSSLSWLILPYPDLSWVILGFSQIWGLPLGKNYKYSKFALSKQNSAHFFSSVFCSPVVCFTSRFGPVGLFGHCYIFLYVGVFPDLVLVGDLLIIHAQ